jgi:plasmid stability protein
MSVSITVRDVPDDVRDALASRAAASGRSLQEFLSAELKQLASRPSIDAAIAAARGRARHYPAADQAGILSDLDADRR